MFIGKINRKDIQLEPFENHVKYPSRFLRYLYYRFRLTILQWSRQKAEKICKGCIQKYASNFLWIPLGTIIVLLSYSHTMQYKMVTLLKSTPQKKLNKSIQLLYSEFEFQAKYARVCKASLVLNMKENYWQHCTCKVKFVYIIQICKYITNIIVKPTISTHYMILLLTFISR